MKEYESNKGLSIKESSVPFDKENLTEEDKQELIKYCIHDVDATEQLLLDRTEYIQSKLELAKMFNISPFKALKCTNAKLCSIILKAYFIEREPDYQYVLPDKIRNYVYDNLPESVISQFFTLNNENKEVKLFDNDIVFGIGPAGTGKTYLAACVANALIDKANFLSAVLIAHHAAYDDRLGVAKHILESVELNAERHAEHDECQDDVHQCHLSSTQIRL